MLLPFLTLSHFVFLRLLANVTADAMDKKLLLAVQYQCNSIGLAIPWNDIGTLMGPKITGGAVIQHLAKMRTRMITQNLSVPPPLRRGGGGARISTTTTSSAPKTKTASTKKGDSGKANQTSTKAMPGKSKKAGKKAPSSDSDESDEDDDWKDDDSDAEYGEPRAKRAKTSAKGSTRRKFKTEDSDEEVEIPSNAPKRKHKTSKSSSRELSAYGTTDINGVPLDDPTDTEDETNAELVGAGESWLDLEDDYASHPKTGKKTPFKKSLVVALPNTPHKTEAADRMIDDESGDEVVGGAVENCVGGFQVSPINQHNNPYQMDQHAMTLNGGMYEEELNDPESLNYMFNHQGSATQDTRGFGGINGSFGTDGAAMLDNGSAYNNVQGVPYAIQTTWPGNHGSVGPSSSYSSVNQTPAGTSAGADFGTGYFGNGQFDLDPFGDANVNFSATDGADTFFNAEDYNDDFFDDGYLPSNHYNHYGQ